MLNKKLLSLTLIAIATMLCAPVRFAAAADSSAPAAKPPASSDSDSDNLQAEESDPLAPFNSAMFTFNLKVDDYVLHPVASGYAKVVPTSARQAIDRALDNLHVLPRFANNLFQLRIPQAGSEVARFGINTSVGLLGLFDPAGNYLGLKEHPDDFGLTLRYYGAPTGPYLMLPFFGPSTITDTVGKVADGFMYPLPYFVPWYIYIPAEAGEDVADAVSYRSLHLDQFEQADRYAVDLYGAVQDYYLQSRNNRVKDLKSGAD
jgi:phospholipid-binding lipoprotein MlaA